MELAGAGQRLSLGEPSASRPTRKRKSSAPTANGPERPWMQRLTRARYLVGPDGALRYDLPALPLDGEWLPSPALYP